MVQGKRKQEKFADMRQNSFLKNIIYNFSYQMLLIIVPLITTPYLSRILGADRIGEYSFAQSVVSYFCLAAVLGTALYGQRAVAEAKSDLKARSALFLEIFFIRLFSVCLLLGAYYFLIVSRAANKTLYWLLAVELVSVCFDVSWFFQGMESFRTITLFSGAGKILGTICIFCFVRSPADLNLYVLFSCGSVLTGYIAAWSALPGLVRFQGLRLQKLLSHLKSSLKLFVPQFAIQVYTVLDKTMIGLITKSNPENAYYEQSQKLVKVLITIVTSVNAVVASRVTILWAQDRRDEAKRLIENSFRVILAMSLPMALGLWLIAPSVIPLYFGRGYDKVIPLVRILALLLPIIGCSNIVGMQLFVPIKKERWLTCSVVAGVAVNVGLNAFLIPRFASAGAAAASVLAELAVTLVQLALARKLISLLRVLKILLRYLCFTGVMAVPALALSAWLRDGFLYIVVQVVLCCAVYFLLLLLTKDPVLDIRKGGRRGKQRFS